MICAGGEEHRGEEKNKEDHAAEEPVVNKKTLTGSGGRGRVSDMRMGTG